MKASVRTPVLVVFGRGSWLRGSNAFRNQVTNTQERHELEGKKNNTSAQLFLDVWFFGNKSNQTPTESLSSLYHKHASKKVEECNTFSSRECFSDTLKDISKRPN